MGQRGCSGETVASRASRVAGPWREAGRPRDGEGGRAVEGGRAARRG